MQIVKANSWNISGRPDSLWLFQRSSAFPYQNLKTRIFVSPALQLKLIRFAEFKVKVLRPSLKDECRWNLWDGR